MFFFLLWYLLHLSEMDIQFTNRVHSNERRKSFINYLWTFFLSNEHKTLFFFSFCHKRKSNGRYLNHSVQRLWNYYFFFFALLISASFFFLSCQSKYSLIIFKKKKRKSSSLYCTKHSTLVFVFDFEQN